MATIVYIWKNSQSEPGHASMQVGNEYISYWPESAAGKKDFKIGQTHEAVFPKSYKVDCRLEGKQCEHSIILNGLNESVIISHWNTFKNYPPKYNMVKHNCSTVIATMLEIGSNVAPLGAPRLRINEYAGNNATKIFLKLRFFGDYIHMWTPNTVWQYANHINSAINLK